MYAEEEEADIIIDDNSPQHLKRHLKKVSFQTNEPISPSENYKSGNESIKNKDIMNINSIRNPSKNRRTA